MCVCPCVRLVWRKLCDGWHTILYAQEENRIVSRQNCQPADGNSHRETADNPRRRVLLSEKFLRRKADD